MCVPAAFHMNEQNVNVSYRVPESELSLAHPGESCGEDVAVSGEDGSHWPDPLMWSQTFLLASRGTDITIRGGIAVFVKVSHCVLKSNISPPNDSLFCCHSLA